MNTQQSVLVVGGGFAGVSTAISLASRGVSVILVSKSPDLQYYPGIFRVFARVTADAVLLPLDSICKSYQNIRLVVDSVTHIDPGTKTITTTNGQTFFADYLVVAPGSIASYFNIPELSETTHSIRSGGDVERLVHHIDQLFNNHQHAPREEQSVAFRFVVVGGGPTGVELSAELAQYARLLAHRYHIDESLVVVDLVEAQDRVLYSLSQQVSDSAKQRLVSLGVNILCGHRVIANHSWTVELSNTKLGARTVVWTAGVAPHPIISNIAGFSYSLRGRVVVDDHMQAVGYPGIYIAGDCAETLASGLAQTALYDGTFIADDICAVIARSKRPQYVVPKTAHIVPIGDGWAVADIYGVVISGWLAWVLRGVVDFRFIASLLGVRQAWRRVFVDVKKDI